MILTDVMFAVEVRKSSTVPHTKKQKIQTPLYCQTFAPTMSAFAWLMSLCVYRHLQRSASLCELDGRNRLKHARDGLTEGDDASNDSDSRKLPGKITGREEKLHWVSCGEQRLGAKQAFVRIYGNQYAFKCT
jgi:hypothetical protein